MKLRVWGAEAGTGTASQGAGRRAPMMKTEKGARSGDGEGACHAVVELAVELIGARRERDREADLVVGRHVLRAAVDASDLKVVQRVVRVVRVVEEERHLTM